MSFKFYLHCNNVVRVRLADHNSIRKLSDKVGHLHVDHGRAMIVCVLQTLLPQLVVRSKAPAIAVQKL